MTRMVRLLPVGMITGTGMIGSAATTLIEDHNISLHGMLAVGAVVLPAAWWLANRLSKFDFRMEQLEQTHMRIMDRLTGIERAIDSLPCEQKCVEKRPHPKIRPHMP